MSMIDRTTPLTQVMALQTAAWFSCGQRRLDEALERAETALRIARTTDEIDVVAVSLNLLGAVHVLRREEDLAEQYWNEAFEILPAKHRTLSSILNNSAALSRIRADTAEAERLFYASIEALPDDEREQQSGNAYINLAELKFEAGDLAGARAFFTKGLRQFLDQHNTENLFHSIEGAAELEFKDGHPERAAVLLGWVDRTKARLGIEPGAFSVDYRPVNPSVEQALGEARFHDLFERGALMTEEEAALFAIEGPPLESSATAPAVPAEAIAEHPLTPRELDVLRLVAQGKSNQEIADVLFISMRTAQTHVTNMLGKLGLDSRAALAAYAVRHGLA
jgi:DNA-binding NarL/FixJ family response regulator